METILVLVVLLYLYYIPIISEIASIAVVLRKTYIAVWYHTTYLFEGSGTHDIVAYRTQLQQFLDYLQAKYPLCGLTVKCS